MSLQQVQQIASSKNGFAVVGTQASTETGDAIADALFAQGLGFRV